MNMDEQEIYECVYFHNENTISHQNYTRIYSYARAYQHTFFNLSIIFISKQVTNLDPTLLAYLL